AERKATRLLPLHLAQQQELVVGALDGARDIFLEHARVGFALDQRRLVGRLAIALGEEDERGRDQHEQRDAEIGERLGERPQKDPLLPLHRRRPVLAARYPREPTNKLISVPEISPFALRLTESESVRMSPKGRAPTQKSSLRRRGAPR